MSQEQELTWDSGLVELCEGAEIRAWKSGRLNGRGARPERGRRAVLRLV